MMDHRPSFSLKALNERTTAVSVQYLWLMEVLQNTQIMDETALIVDGDHSLLAALQMLWHRSEENNGAAIVLILRHADGGPDLAMRFTSREDRRALLQLDIDSVKAFDTDEGHLHFGFPGGVLNITLPGASDSSRFSVAVLAMLQGLLPAKSALASQPPGGAALVASEAIPVNARKTAEFSLEAGGALGLRATIDPPVEPGAARLFLLSAASPAALKARLREWKVVMPKKTPFLQEDLSEGPGPCRLAILAEDDATFFERIDQALSWLERNPERSRRQQNGLWYSPSPIDQPRIAVMFPGHGAQYPAMLCAHERHMPVVRSWFYELSQIYGQGIHPCPLRHLPMKGETSAEREHLQSMYALEGGGIHGMIGSVALYHALRLAGIEADILCGYSNGENAAMIASGVASYQSISALFERIACIATAGQGGLSRGEIPLGATLSVTFAEPDRLQHALADLDLDLDLVASNSPFNFVLYGATATVEVARPLLEAKGAIVLPLPNDRSYHTPHFAPELPSMREVLDSIDFQQGRIPVFSCSALTNLPGDNPDALRTMATQQYVTPVRFRESIDLLSEKGFNLFIDVGPRGQLAAMARETLSSGKGMVIECDRRDRDGWFVMLAALAQLHVAGLSPNPANWFQPANAALKGDALLSSLTLDFSPHQDSPAESGQSQ